MKVFVYTLADPRDAESVRYVGVCLNPRRRLASHLSQCERGRTRRANWVRKVNGTKVVRKLCNKGHPLEPGNIVYECGGKVRRCATCFITKQERSRAKQRQQKS